MKKINDITNVNFFKIPNSFPILRKEKDFLYNASVYKKFLESKLNYINLKLKIKDSLYQKYKDNGPFIHNDNFYIKNYKNININFKQLSCTESVSSFGEEFYVNFFDEEFSLPIFTDSCKEIIKIDEANKSKYDKLDLFGFLLSPEIINFCNRNPFVVNEIGAQIYKFAKEMSHMYYLLPNINPNNSELEFYIKSLEMLE